MLNFPMIILQGIGDDYILVIIYNTYAEANFYNSTSHI